MIRAKIRPQKSLGTYEEDGKTKEHYDHPELVKDGKGFTFINFVHIPDVSSNAQLFDYYKKHYENDYKVTDINQLSVGMFRPIYTIHLKSDDDEKLVVPTGIGIGETYVVEYRKD